MSTRLWLVRHGQTDWNLEGRIQGHTPTGLNATGREQACRLAAHFAGKAFAALYSSDLPRAEQTAGPIGQGLGLSVRTTPLLRERDLGPYVGLLEPQMIQLRKTAGAGPGRGDLADWTGVPDVESDDQLWSRADAIFRQIIAAHPDGDVLVVTHGGIIYRTVFVTLGIPASQPRHFSLANAMLAIIEYRLNESVGGAGVVGKDVSPFLLTLADLDLLANQSTTPDTATARA